MPASPGARHHQRHHRGRPGGAGEELRQLAQAYRAIEDASQEQRVGDNDGDDKTATHGSLPSR